MRAGCNIFHPFIITYSVGLKCPDHRWFTLVRLMKYENEIRNKKLDWKTLYMSSTLFTHEFNAVKFKLYAPKSQCLIHYKQGIVPCVAAKTLQGV
ncbi:hypothetical protein SUGI_0734390 [Cryptomeria japonica]|nr:hypothetical protein SUGI_0734390 [Cryptomeria japonica]